MSDAYPAARGLDPITHSVELCGLIGGSLIGAFVGGLVLGAAIASGGIVIAVAAVGAVGAVGLGGVSGGQLAKGLQTVFHLPDPETGALVCEASPDVWAGGRRSARAKLDAAVTCDGLWSMAHPAYGPVKIAEGSKTVIINGFPAARVTSKLVCGAAIGSGEDTVIIGGPTIRVLEVHDIEAELKEIFSFMMEASMIGVVLLAPEAIPILLLFMGASEILGSLGDAIGPGWRDILQGTLGFAALGAAARGALDVANGAKGAGRREQVGAGEQISNRFPENPGQIEHIFRNAEGHLPDTPANRQLLQQVADDPSTTLGTDKFGNVWSARTLEDGTQAWVQTRDGVIRNGGLNQTPRVFNSNTGLSGQ